MNLRYFKISCHLLLDLWGSKFLRDDGRKYDQYQSGQNVDQDIMKQNINSRKQVNLSRKRRWLVSYKFVEHQIKLNSSTSND